MKIVQAVLVAGLLSLYSSPILANNDSLEAKIIRDSQDRINYSLSSLANLQETIASETLPIALSIEKEQEAIAHLSDKLNQFRRREDSLRISLQTLEQDVDSLKGVTITIDDLIDRHQQERANLISQAQSQFTELEDQDIFERLRNTTVEFSIAERKTRFEGQALDKNGTLLNGEYWRAGNNLWFFPKDGGVALSFDAGHEYPQLLESSFRSTPDKPVSTTSSITLPTDSSNGKAIKLAQSNQNLWQRIATGGIWTIPIIVLGATAFALSLVCSFRLWRCDNKEETNPAFNFIRDNQMEKARKASESYRTPYGSLTRLALQQIESDQRLDEEFLADSIAQIRHQLQRHLAAIAVTASVAPLLGLLGTVTGMIKTFEKISLFGSSNSDSIAGGISEALITTELGLAVAIPLVLIHVALNRKVKSIVAELADFAPRLYRSLNTSPAHQ